MLIYNITFQVDFNEARNFVIWAHQVYIQKSLATGLLQKARLCKILSHHDADTECFSLQFEVESSAVLHQWFCKTGKQLHDEMVKLFEEKVVAFSTLMEVIEES